MAEPDPRPGEPELPPAYFANPVAPVENSFQPVDYPADYPGPPGYPPLPPPVYPTAYQPPPPGYPPTYPPPQQPGGYYPPYNHDPYRYDPYNSFQPGVPTGTNGKAIAAIASGAAGLALCMCFVPSLAAIVLGIIAMGETKRTGQAGNGLALGGLLLGVLTLLMGIFIMVGAADS